VRPSNKASGLGQLAEPCCHIPVPCEARALAKRPSVDCFALPGTDHSCYLQCQSTKSRRLFLATKFQMGTRTDLRFGCNERRDFQGATIFPAAVATVNDPIVAAQNEIKPPNRADNGLINVEISRWGRRSTLRASTTGVGTRRAAVARVAGTSKTYEITNKHI
jgi:hypothetical protein